MSTSEGKGPLYFFTLFAGRKHLSSEAAHFSTAKYL